MSGTRAVPERRAGYVRFERMPTRWSDNDVYQHVNNVVYYAFFDTVVNRMLIDEGLLDIRTSSVVGLVVETGCSYFSPIAFPDEVNAGLRVAHLGRSSVRYEIALFRNDADAASAQGHFVHVYVDRSTSQPTPLPEKLRAALQRLRHPAP